MMKRLLRRKAVTAAAVSSAALIGLAVGSAMAAPADHSAIVLKNAGGTAITKNVLGSDAFSVKTTCFTAGCHGDAAAGGKAVYNYNDIERHNYHAQLGSNQIAGFNPWNPDGSAWHLGAGPMGKNWVQSPGHIGSW